MKTAILWISILFTLFIGSNFLFLNSLNTNEAILGVTTNSYRFPPQNVFYFYLKNFRDFQAQPDDLDPLTFTFNGCYDRLPSDRGCTEMIDLILSKGVSIDNPSNDNLGLTVLHGAVLNCSKGSVQYILSKGANVNSIVDGDHRFQGMTALAFLDELEQCEDQQALRELLLANGAHI